MEWQKLASGGRPFLVASHGLVLWRMRTQACSESRPQVVLFRVLPHHAPGGELRHEGNHGSTNPLEPLPRDTLGVALVKQNTAQRSRCSVIFLALARIAAAGRHYPEIGFVLLKPCSLR